MRYVARCIFDLIVAWFGVVFVLGIIGAWLESINHVEEERRMKERLAKWEKFFRERFGNKVL